MPFVSVVTNSSLYRCVSSDVAGCFITRGVGFMRTLAKFVPWVKFFTKHRFPLVPHTSYSLDLAQSDIFVFPKLERT
jgi:hypothetical protein